MKLSAQNRQALEDVMGQFERPGPLFKKPPNGILIANSALLVGLGSLISVMIHVGTMDKPRYIIKQGQAVQIVPFTLMMIGAIGMGVGVTEGELSDGTMNAVKSVFTPKGKKVDEMIVYLSTAHGLLNTEPSISHMKLKSLSVGELIRKLGIYINQSHATSAKMSKVRIARVCSFTKPGDYSCRPLDS